MKKILNNKIIVYPLITLAAIFTVFSLFNNPTNHFDIRVSQYHLIYIILVPIFIKLYHSYYIKENHSFHLSFLFLSLLFAFFMVFGYSFNQVNSWNLVLDSTLSFIWSFFIGIGYTIFFYYGINIFYEYSIKIANKKENKTNKVFQFIFKKHSILTIIIILLICWLPYIIITFPGACNPDTVDQIKQFYGMDTWTANRVILINPNIYLNNHHPVFHTMIMGFFIHIGYLLGSAQLGFASFILCQAIGLAATLAYLLHYMKKINIPEKIRFIFLLIFAFLPVFPYYALTAVKDVPFTICMILATIFILDYTIQPDKFMKKKKNIAILALSLLLMELFRNNGVYMAIILLPFILFVQKKYWKQVLLMVLLPIVIYMGYGKILLPSLGISDGSIREVLSIPFQQTARYVTNYDKEITKEEKEIIDKILVYDTIKERYKPRSSDPIKHEFNKNASREDLKKYFEVWFKQLQKHPKTYIAATMNNYYGYFYPNYRGSLLDYYQLHSDIEQIDIFTIKHFEKLATLRKIGHRFNYILANLPLIGMFYSMGLYTWIIFTIIVILLIKKKYKYLVPFILILTNLLVNCAAPLNAHVRYSIPIIFTMPIVIATYLYAMRGEKIEKIN